MPWALREWCFQPSGLNPKSCRAKFASARLSCQVASRASKDSIATQKPLGLRQLNMLSLWGIPKPVSSQMPTTPVLRLGAFLPRSQPNRRSLDEVSSRIPAVRQVQLRSVDSLPSACVQHGKRMACPGLRGPGQCQQCLVPMLHLS